MWSRDVKPLRGHGERYSLRVGGGNVQPPPGYIDDGSPEEDAHELWCAVRIMAVNRRRDGPYLSNDEFWAEFEDELGAYEEANGLEPLGD